MAKLVDVFLKGGPVMWPILGLSILGLAILIWKAFEFRAGRVNAKGLTVVSTIITAEPMLGILGTVIGIMQTFGALNGTDANPLAATAGIGEALITTAAGLTQRRVTAAKAGLAIRSEPSRAKRVPRDAKCAEK